MTEPRTPMTRTQPCIHSTYSLTVYGNCMACENAALRAERDELKGQLLESKTNRNRRSSHDET